MSAYDQRGEAVSETMSTSLLDGKTPKFALNAKCHMTDKCNLRHASNAVNSANSLEMCATAVI
jgi:hypothetical protein